MDSLWNAHIVDSAAVRLQLNDSSWEWMLGIATRKWREVLRDQWDLRDLDWRNDSEAALRVPGADDAGVRPFVNSHYSRQLLGVWALVAGLSTQRHDVQRGTLTFVRRRMGQRHPRRFPFFTTMGNGHMRELSSPTAVLHGERHLCFEVIMFSGRLQATVVVDGKVLAPVVDVAAGDIVVACR
eukprot:COSAG01_NODE_3621_length_5860_cov_4.719840_5_plen_183_part_00